VRLHGLVRLANGRPAAKTDLFLDIWGRAQKKLKTAADGSYSVTLSDAPRLVEFRAGAAGFSQVLLVSPKKGKDEVRLDVSLHPIPVLKGTVTLPDGKPAASIVLDVHGGTWRDYGAIARAHGWPDSESFGASGSGVRLTITTDQAGRYRVPLIGADGLRESSVEPVPQGWGEGTEYQLRFISPQGAGWAGPLKMTVDPKVAEPRLDIRLRAGDQLEGTVVGYPGKQPMAGAQVIVTMSAGMMHGVMVVVAQTTANAQGRFRIPAALPPGEYQVGAAAAGGWGFIGLPEDQARALRDGKVAQRRHLELRLVRDAMVPVRFLDPSGEPIRNAAISMTVTAAAEWGDQIKTDAQGRHVFEIRSRAWVKEHWASGAAHLQVEAMAPQLGLTGYLDLDLTAPRPDQVDLRMDRPVSVSAGRPQEKPRAIPIQGRLLVTAFGNDGETGEGDSFLIAGTSNDVSRIPLSLDQADLSPAADELVYAGAADGSPPSSRHLLKASLRNPNPVDLSARAKLTGVSCAPCWSPDGQMIAFQHVRPKKGESPCDTGFQIWVMNADGTGVRQVTRTVAPGLSDWSPRWTADGSGVVYESYDGLATMRINGTQRRLLAGGLGQADLDRDGGRAVVARSVMGDVNGQHGDWRQLLLVDVLTGARHVLVQQFVSESQAAAHLKRVGPQTASDTEAVDRAVGPNRPRWSPDGTQIAFLAALPFDPKGPPYRQQVEVWVYDLATRGLSRSTDDQREQSWLSWR